MPLDELRLETFSGRVGERFRVRSEGSETVELELTEATGTGGPELKRPPFSLVFKAGEGVVIMQQVYILEHDELGTLDVFLVPLTEKTCEAVFT